MLQFKKKRLFRKFFYLFLVCPWFQATCPVIRLPTYKKCTLCRSFVTTVRSEKIFQRTSFSIGAAALKAVQTRREPYLLVQTSHALGHYPKHSCRILLVLGLPNLREIWRQSKVNYFGSKVVSLAGCGPSAIMQRPLSPFSVRGSAVCP